MSDRHTISVRVPFAVRKCGGRKLVVSPDGYIGTLPRSRMDNVLVKAIGRAHRWQRLMDKGKYATLGELAAAEKISKSYLCRVLRLTLLAPEIVEAILDGRQSEGLTVKSAMETFPVEWKEQLSFFERE